MMMKNFSKNPTIEGYESIRFKTNGSIVAYTNQYGLVGSVYNSDVAEAFRYDPEFVKEMPEEGTVMVLNRDNGLVIPAHDQIDFGRFYIGVVRFEPGLFLGADFKNWNDLFSQGFVPLAIIGQVRVKLHPSFEYHIGDKLVSYIDGTARPLMHSDDEWFGKVIKLYKNDYCLTLIK